ncbi:MAG TPA: protein-L-isoaspartate O-methyltransferase [Candidatus Saccharimonadales bacterium]|nr:protein-L-isoaspartate O-methyltransferase [Candidatus Saccharimonadales bacterium]
MGSVDSAFQSFPREKFLPSQAGVGFDVALPIGFGQTISQPTTVRYMLDWLDVEPGDKILDVGSGSGWTSALLAYLTGSTGRVYAVEIIPELVQLGRDNCRRLGIHNLEFHKTGSRYGLPRYGPYDRILVSAAGDEVPGDLLSQVAVGGKMVIPIDEMIYEIEKLSEGNIDVIEHPGFAFVPLVEPLNGR